MSQDAVTSFYDASWRHCIGSGEALDLATDAAAWEEATIASCEILKGLDGSLSPDREWKMDVIDEAGAKVFTLRLISEWHRHR